MKYFLTCLLVLVHFLPSPLLKPVAAQNNGAPLSLVELYTSQGCSSCPPADAFLGKLIERQDVLALSFHVDYWNYIGWDDPYSDAAYTARQRNYARQLNLRYVYTPQMVVQGKYETTGHKKREISNFIDHAKSLPQIAINLEITSDTTLSVQVDGWDEPLDQPFEVWAAVYDKHHETAIKRGENTGRKLENFNVVRTLKKLGEWSGNSKNYHADLKGLIIKGGDGCAVFIQSPLSGSIVGVANINL